MAPEDLVARVRRVVGVVPPPLEEALRTVPLDLFSAEAVTPDLPPLLLREGRLPHPPETAARLVHALRVTSSDRVLVVGTGFGYETALLARLVREVYSVEWLAPVAARASRVFAALEVPNVSLRKGNASAFADKAPFDAILVPHGGAGVPEYLKDRLSAGGRLVTALGERRARETLVRLTRRAAGGFDVERLGELRFEHRLGDLLVQSGAASRSMVEEAAAEASTANQPLGKVLQGKGQISEKELARAIGRQRGMVFGNVDELIPEIDPTVVGLIPRPFLEHHAMIPIARKGDSILLATSNPEAADPEVAKVFHPALPEFRLVTPSDYRRLWNAVDLLLSGSKVATPVKVELSEIGALDEPRLEQRFVDLFESLLLDAIAERASDVHLERYGERVRVRIRVDGDLRDVPRYRLNTTDLVGVVNVVKIRADLNITEHRLPQGGRIRVRAGGKNFDLRVQTQPALHGEHVVIRLLPQDVKLLAVEDLGFSPEVAKEYRRLLEHPSGLVLVVGPTGSGKTTTLYAGLEILARDLSRKVITVEDPIEYSIEGVQQTQVHPEIGFSFADAMRSFVRQDPDVILVGEVRDSETALEAIRASQTGHLVLSTLHCNDTTDAVQRLTDLGMHPNSIASELLAVMSQRLPRRICDGCRTEAAPPSELLDALFPRGVPAEFRSWKGAGCSRCAGQGTYGRIACVEFLRTNTALRAAISRRPAVEDLRRMALEAKLIPLRDEALNLVRKGLISLQELPILLPWERLGPERAE